MKINMYITKWNADRVYALVKEKARLYPDDKCNIDSPEKAAALIEYVYDASKLAQEYFWLITLDGARRVTGVFTVSTGTLMSSLVHPREVFIRAILAGSASVIIAHNHPSGMLDISEQDREVSRRIKQAGELLGIHLDDHIVVANKQWISAM